MRRKIGAFLLSVCLMSTFIITPAMAIDSEEQSEEAIAPAEEATGKEFEETEAVTDETESAIEEAAEPETVDGEAEPETADSEAASEAADAETEPETADAETEADNGTEEEPLLRTVTPPATSGQCGKNAYWEITESSEGMRLTITGFGKMEDYSWGHQMTPDSPWYSYHDQITELVIDDRITVLGTYAFCDLSEIKATQLPEDLEVIREECFRDCYSLERIIIPEKVRLIEDDAFFNCDSLCIFVPTTLESAGINAFGSWNEGMIVSYQGTEQQWSQLPTEWVISENASICDGAAVYYGISDAAHMITDREDIQTGKCGDDITWTLLETDYGKTLLLSGTGSTYNYEEEKEVPWKTDRTSVQRIEIGEGITRIGKEIFRGMGKLRSVSLPDSLLTVDSYAFYECSRLCDLSIPSNVTEIGEAAFSDTAIRHIILPDSIEVAGDACFYGACTIWVPSTIVSIDSPGADTIWFQGTEEEWESLGVWTDGIVICNVTNPDAVVYAEDVELDHTEIALEEGETARIRATLTPGNATANTIKWRTHKSQGDTHLSPVYMTVSEDPEDSYVDLEWCSLGTDTLYAYSYDGEAVADCKIYCYGVWFDPWGSEEVRAGNTIDLYDYTIATLPAGMSELTWTSSDPSIVEILDNGIALAHKQGEVTITVSAGDGKYTHSNELTVYSPLAFEGYDEIYDLYYVDDRIDPSHYLSWYGSGEMPAVTWISSDPETAEFDQSGILTARKTGVVTITAATADGLYTAETNVKIIEPIVLESASVKFDDVIGLRYKMTIDVNAEGHIQYYYRIGAGNRQEIDRDSIEYGYDENGDFTGKVTITVPVWPKQVHETVVFEALNNKKNVCMFTKSGKDVTEGFSYSVHQYCESIQGQSSNQKMKTLAAAMEQYSTYVQKYLKYSGPTGECSSDFSDITLDNLSAFAGKSSGAAEGIRLSSMSFSFDEASAVNLKYTVSEGMEVDNDFLIQVDGDDVYPWSDVYYYTIDSNGKCIVKLTGINAVDLDQMHLVTITDPEGNSLNVQVCGLSYAYSIMKSTTSSQSAKEAVCALYKYYLAAKDYFRK